MAQPLFPDDEEFYCPEYKIVDLPIIDVPVLQPMKTFNAKIYRWAGEWKRICHGRIKFYKLTYVIVSAFENWSCHKRMHQIPTIHPEHYNLEQCEEFPNNWTFINEKETKISIALGVEDFEPFKALWNTIKEENTQLMEINWLEQIEIDLFE